jgi:pimeloyl-ACP methyl ester carboxylesterase
LITGAFISHTCWDPWRSYFESKGYTVLAPPWPHKEAKAQELRSRHPDSNIASIRLNGLIDYFAGIIKQLPVRPVLIGHSLGGLITQILLHRDLAAAGVAIHSVPPQGVLPLQFTFYRSTWKSLGFFTSAKASYLMSFKDWQYAFANGMPLEEQQRSYEQFAVPETKLGIRDALTSVAKIDFRKPHAPLLFIAGCADQCIPAELNVANFERYKDRFSVTEFRAFKGRNHFVLGQPTWQEDAEFILSWLECIRRKEQVVKRPVEIFDD